MTQLTLFPYRNRDLFSDYYLQELIIKEEVWKEIDDKTLKEKFEKIKEIYEDKKSILAEMEEPDLREQFIHKILKILDHQYKVETDVKLPESTKSIDCSLFADKKSKDDAEKIHKKDLREFYKNVVGILEAKRWNKDLSSSSREHKDEFDNKSPEVQIDTYLRFSEVSWGILTNGKKWRLYCKESSHLRYYYEVDLKNIIEEGNLEHFKYFYIFFRAKAFPEFLDKAYQGRIDYAKKVGEELKENVYDALKILAEGFLKFPKNNLKEEDIETIRNNCFILLYRLLFILYGESKKFGEEEDNTLLPIKTNQTYRDSYSLDSIKREIAEKVDKRTITLQTNYYHRLKELFNLINEGSEKLGLKGTLYVPAYNGGLFDPEKHKFLEEKTIGDLYLANAIEKLCRTAKNGKGFIYYSDLEIRHLGSIYEGLLEYKLQIAKEDLAIVKEKGKEIYVSLEKARSEKMKFNEIVKKGEVYNITDKGERKATGSYYTPDYIVKYIVENTLKPIIEEKCKIAREKGENESKAILSIKVLDPAMGSGHFLVESVEFLAKELRDAIDRDVEKGLAIQIENAKREIVSNCIYGVDLNELAVELAKVSLWLSTVAKDKPLSFLEHRLKCGNSLIGAKLEDLPKFPEKKKEKEIDESQKKFEQDTINPYREKLAKKINELSKIKEEKLQDIKEKEKLYNELKEMLEYDRIKTLADVYTSIYFGNNLTKENYMDLTAKVSYAPKGEWEDKKKVGYVQYGIKKEKDKKFFHWELEFPEVFLENGGFDCVVGNPPYVNIYELSKSEDDIKFYQEKYQTAVKKFDLYIPFAELSYRLIKKSGYHGFIVPDKWLYVPYGENLRELFINNIISIFDFTEFRVFDDPTVSNVVYFIQKNETKITEIEIKKFISKTQYKNWKIPITYWENSPSKMFRLMLIDKTLPILDKILKRSIKWNEIFYVNWGCRPVPFYDYFIYEKKDESCVPAVKGEDVQRYYFDYKNSFLRYIPDKLYNPMFKELFENKGIYIKDIGGKGRISAVLNDENYYTTHTVNVSIKWKVIPIKKRGSNFEDEYLLNDNYDIFYCLGIVNSILLSFYYRIYLSDFLHTVPDNVRNLPIPQISFSTPKEQRKKLLENAIAIYEKELRQ